MAIPAKSRDERMRLEPDERNDAPFSGFPQNHWGKILMATKNQIMTTGGTVCYNEDFLAGHPNFTAPEEDQ